MAEFHPSISLGYPPGPFTPLPPRRCCGAPPHLEALRAGPGSRCDRGSARLPVRSCSLNQFADSAGAAGPRRVKEEARRRHARRPQRAPPAPEPSQGGAHQLPPTPEAAARPRSRPAALSTERPPRPGGSSRRRREGPGGDPAPYPRPPPRVTWGSAGQWRSELRLAAAIAVRVERGRGECVRRSG